MTASYTRLRPRKDGSDSPRATIASWQILLTLPTVVLMLIASLDNADKKLMESSFPIFEQVLQWDVRELGYFSLATNLSYALSLPFWGWLIHRYNAVHSLQKLLAYACLVWGIAIVAIALVTLCSAASQSTAAAFWTHLQISVRAINGMALGSILPLSQSLLVEYVPGHFQGQAFGMMGASEKLAGTLSSAAVVYLGVSKWQYAYYTLGILSICMAEACAPIMVSVSSGLPCLIALTRSSTRAMNVFSSPHNRSRSGRSPASCTATAW